MTTPILYIFGIISALAAGALLAVSMNVQRYALVFVATRWEVPHSGGRTVNKNVLWIGGLVLYGIASGGLYSLAGLWIPLSLLSCLFLTLLAFNLFFARVMCHEEPTRPKVAGAVTLLVGAFR